MIIAGVLDVIARILLPTQRNDELLRTEVGRVRQPTWSNTLACVGTRTGERYIVTDDERARFERDGFVHLPEVMTQAELVDLDSVYGAFMRGEIEVQGRDLNDMVTGQFGSDPTKYVIFNVMLPRVYYPEWKGNTFALVGRSIAEQLCGEGMTLDFDQLLAEPPGRADAVFVWHQDQAHRINTDDRRTATCWLAIDDSTVDNGCMQFLPGSDREPVRRHRPAGESREEQHTLVTDLQPDDHPIPVPIRRGDITVHNEGVLHGSGGGEFRHGHRGVRSDRRRETSLVAAFVSRRTCCARRSTSGTFRPFPCRHVRATVES